MKVLKRVDKDLSSLSGKATQRKAELVALEKKVQKQNKKMLKLMECIDLVLECVDKLEEQVEERCCACTQPGPNLSKTQEIQKQDKVHLMRRDKAI